MSLAKIPFVFLFGLATHVSSSPPNPTVPKEQRVTGDSDGRIELHLVTFIMRYSYWVHAAIELVIILAAAVPESTVAELVLNFLLPGRNPSRIFLSYTGILATASAMMGGVIRFQSFRAMGKHFTFQVTILKDHKLVTSGPYSYVRHPGYTGAIFTMAGMVIWYTAQGSWLREIGIYNMPLGWFVVVPVIVYFFGVLIAGLSTRIAAEDEMLKNTFGNEWDEWARKVPARLMPGIY